MAEIFNNLKSKLQKRDEALKADASAKANALKVEPDPAKRKRRKDYKGRDHITNDMFVGWKNRAVRDEIPFNLTIDELEKMYVDQNATCPVTGRKLSLETGHPDKVSLDRVDSSGNYNLDNVRFVTKGVNFARHDLTDSDLRSLCADLGYIDRLRERAKGRAGNWYAKLARTEYKRIFGCFPDDKAKSL